MSGPNSVLARCRSRSRCLTFYTLAARRRPDGAGDDLIWVPISVWIGLRPRWAEAVQPFAQFLAAFPVNLLVRRRGQPGADCSISIRTSGSACLIVFGTQWYIVFNTIGGAAAFPNDLREAAANFRISAAGTWWRQVMLPGESRPIT